MIADDVKFVLTYTACFVILVTMFLAAQWMMERIRKYRGDQ